MQILNTVTDVPALQFAANEARAEANHLLTHARDAQRRARAYETQLAIVLATKPQTK